MYGKDYEYAGTRLNQTLVRYNGKLVEVIQVRGDGNVEIRHIKNDEVERVKLDRLNLEPLPLGYANIKGANALYTYRIPKRNDWRQGSRAANLGYRQGGEHHQFDVDYRFLLDVVDNLYPTFEEARKKSKEVGRVIAWCRAWAVAPTGEVRNRDRKVGRIIRDKVKLNKGFEYLKESLEESLA